jgi:hypothetical protein
VSHIVAIPSVGRDFLRFRRLQELVVRCFVFCHALRPGTPKGDGPVLVDRFVALEALAAKVRQS